MSRSYRRPWVVDGYGTKWKQWAKANHNRKLRRKLKNPNYHIADGNAHKHGHASDMWDICDYRWMEHEPKADRTFFCDGTLYCYETLEMQLERYKKLQRK